jgi:Arm DNA-binding domain
MATVRLTDALVRRLEAPATGNKIAYDTAVKGFGARVTANGAKAFVLTYVVRGTGRQRRYTIGGCDRWTATDARAKAKELKALVDQGGDPLGAIEAERQAPDMGDLIARFREEHFPRIRKSSAEDYERMLRKYVLRHFSENTKVADVTFVDIDALHRRITKAGHLHRANRVVSPSVGACARRILAAASNAIASTRGDGIWSPTSFSASPRRSPRSPTKTSPMPFACCC